jgi:hypothetical protein
MLQSGTRRGVLLAALAVLFLLASCEQRRPAPITPPDQAYTVRAVVTALPNPPKQALLLHHEAIPQFVGADGKVIGMASMEMEFPVLAPGVSLQGIAAGDKIEFTLEMRWKSAPRYQIGSIKKLPADAAVNLGPE